MVHQELVHIYFCPLITERVWRAIQSCRDLADGLAFGRPSGNVTPFLK